MAPTPPLNLHTSNGLPLCLSGITTPFAFSREMADHDRRRKVFKKMRSNSSVRDTDQVIRSTGGGRHGRSDGGGGGDQLVFYLQSIVQQRLLIFIFFLKTVLCYCLLFLFSWLFVAAGVGFIYFVA